MEFHRSNIKIRGKYLKNGIFSIKMSGKRERGEGKETERRERKS